MSMFDTTDSEPVVDDDEDDDATVESMKARLMTRRSDLDETPMWQIALLRQEDECVMGCRRECDHGRRPRPASNPRLIGDGRATSKDSSSMMTYAQY